MSGNIEGFADHLQYGIPATHIVAKLLAHAETPGQELEVRVAAVDLNDVHARSADVANELVEGKGAPAHQLRRDSLFQLRLKDAVPRRDRPPYPSIRRVSGTSPPAAPPRTQPWSVATLSLEHRVPHPDCPLADGQEDFEAVAVLQPSHGV